jgi:hypothetical protein
MVGFKVFGTHTRIVPVTSSLIATQPLNPAIRATVLPLGMS